MTEAVTSEDEWSVLTRQLDLLNEARAMSSGDFRYGFVESTPRDDDHFVIWNRDLLSNPLSMGKTVMGAGRFGHVSAGEQKVGSSASLLTNLERRMAIVERLLRLEREQRLREEATPKTDMLEELRSMSAESDIAIAAARVSIEDTERFLAARQ